EGASDEAVQEAEKRRERLLNTPFHAVLTTNFDTWLQETPGLPDWGHLLQLPRRDWWKAYDLQQEFSFHARVLKLHGDAEGPRSVVLGRRDYRHLVHGTPRYADFLRAIFATKKVLFVGTSFTDAYLNELRASVLQLLQLEGREPMGWAIMPSRSAARRRFFEQTEHLGVLEYAPEDPLHRGVSQWLEAIYAATAPGARLGDVVKKKRILWVDARPKNNDYGFEVLTRAGAEVDRVLTSPDELDEAAHANADLIITHWGFDPAGAPRGQRVLERTATWSSGRPPIIVFASSQHGSVNRHTALRLGAYEFCWEWGALLENVQRLFSSR
ncbi:MAG TPA: SIR2 family protein, partial [Archangium sp.]